MNSFIAGKATEPNQNILRDPRKFVETMFFLVANCLIFQFHHPSRKAMDSNISLRCLLFLNFSKRIIRIPHTLTPSLNGTRINGLHVPLGQSLP